jgi:hypothetical protein
MRSTKDDVVGKLTTSRLRTLLTARVRQPPQASQPAGRPRSVASTGQLLAGTAGSSWSAVQRDFATWCPVRDQRFAARILRSMAVMRNFLLPNPLAQRRQLCASCCHRTGQAKTLPCLATPRSSGSNTTNGCLEEATRTALRGNVIGVSASWSHGRCFG